MAWIEEEGWLVEPYRLHLRTVARVAYAAVDYAGSPPLDVWLIGRMEQSIRELIDEDRESARNAIPSVEEPDPRYAWVCEPLGIEPAQSILASLAFNGLPRPVRRTCYAILIMGMRVDDWVGKGNGPAERVRGELRTGFLALGRATGTGGFSRMGGLADEP